MKKTLILFVITILLSGCVTYVRETGRWYPNRRYIRPYHGFGINGMRIPNRRYNKSFMVPPHEQLPLKK